MKVKRFVAAATVVTAAAALAVGCGQSEGAQSLAPSGNAKVQGVTTINMAIQAAGQSADEMQKVIDQFNARHKDVHVNASFYGTQTAYNQALLGKVAGGNTPDVFWVDAPVVKEYVQEGILTPLNGLARQTHFPLNTFSRPLLDAFTVKGKLYAIPKDYNVSALIYNKALFRKAHIARPPRTWAELEADAKKLTNGSTYGFGMYPQINYLYPFIASAGGAFVTSDGIKNFVSNGQVRAIQLLSRMLNQEHTAVTPQMLGASWDGEMFANQKVAMVYSGSWVPAAALAMNPKLDIGVAPVPVPSDRDKPVSWSYTAGWGISSKCQHPEQALEFIRFMESPQVLVTGYVRGFDGLPPTSAGMNALIRKNTKNADQLKAYQQLVKESVSFGWLDPNFVNAYNTMLQSIVSNPNGSIRQQLASFAQSQHVK